MANNIGQLTLEIDQQISQLEAYIEQSNSSHRTPSELAGRVITIDQRLNQYTQIRGDTLPARTQVERWQARVYQLQTRTIIEGAIAFHVYINLPTRIVQETFTISNTATARDLQQRIISCIPPKHGASQIVITSMCAKIANLGHHPSDYELKENDGLLQLYPNSKFFCNTDLFVIARE